MNIIHVLFIVLIPFVIVNSQGKRRTHDPVALEKIEQLENARLIKMLDLSEEQSIRFFARRKEHNQKIRELLGQRHELMNSSEALLNVLEKENQKMFKDKIDEALGIESEIVKAKSKYYKSLSNLISPKQILQIMIFEERFRREVREKLTNRQPRKNNE